MRDRYILNGAVCRKLPHSTWQAECIGAQRAILVHYLAANGGDRARTAQALGIHRNNIHRLIRALGIAA